MKLQFSWTCLVLSTLGSLVSLTAIVMNLSASPLGRGTGAYDFSTPQAALRSICALRANGDFRAEVELELGFASHELEEYLRTVQVRHETEKGGQKLLFVAFEKRGIKKFKVEYFNLVARKGVWVRDSRQLPHEERFRSFADVSTAIGAAESRRPFPERIRSPLEIRIESWERTGEL